MPDTKLPTISGDEATPLAPTREELEERVDEAQHSITATVEQIKGTVEERVDAVASTVTGVVTMAEQFQREPVAWSLGALSAGFAMGYSLGRAHHARRANGRPSPLARFADDLSAELASFGDSLVSPELAGELRATFGVDLSAALARIAARQTRPKATTRTTRAKPTRPAPRPRKKPARKRRPKRSP